MKLSRGTQERKRARGEGPTPEAPSTFELLRRSSRFHRPEDSLGFLMYHVTHAWLRQLNSALAEVDMTYLQFVALMGIAWLGQFGSVTQVKLANFTRGDPMLVSKVLRTLERKRAISRRPDPHDSRAKAIKLDEVGFEMAKRALPVVERAYDEFFEPLGGQQTAVHEALTRLFERWARPELCRSL